MTWLRRWTENAASWVQTVVPVGFHQTRGPALNVDFRHFQRWKEAPTSLYVIRPSVHPVMFRSGSVDVSVSARFKSRGKALMSLLNATAQSHKVSKTKKHFWKKKNFARSFVSKRIMCVWLKVWVLFSESESQVGFYDRGLLHFHRIVCIYCAYLSLAH